MKLSLSDPLSQKRGRDLVGNPKRRGGENYHFRHTPDISAVTKKKKSGVGVSEGI